jgi:hypothetical protein
MTRSGGVGGGDEIAAAVVIYIGCRSFDSCTRSYSGSSVRSCRITPITWRFVR